MDILTYGQKELKDVINQLEEQLKTVFMPYQQTENNKSAKKMHKSEIKLNDSDVYNNPKKQRVDKNKCRKCKLSTIPTILHLLQQNDNTDANSNMTMKSIRQQIAQQSHKKEEQSDQKIPYIAFDYSQQIVICKRCRFKFHSECVQIQGALNEWLCDYCLTRIEELKNSNLWDYKNQKQIKQLPNLSSENKKLNLKIIERIQKKKQIYIISEFKPTPNKQIHQISEFLSKYPLYKSTAGNVAYPISEILAVDYPELLSIKPKPKPHMIKSSMVEQILKIQTIYQILVPNSKAPDTFTQEYIEKQFYEILIHLLNQYFDEFILKDDQQFQQYCDQANAITTSYLYLMNYLLHNEEDKNQDLLKKTWKECVIQIDQLDFNDLQFQDKICVLSSLSEGLYDLDIMKDLLKNKEQFLNKGTINQLQLTQADLKVSLQQNYSLFMNGGTYLGQDAHTQQYFYFTFFPSTIFVQTKKGWGQYTISDLTELMNSLNQQGVNELDLLQNLEQIKSIELIDSSTPIKQKNKLTQKQQYQLDTQEVIDKFLMIENSYTQILQKKDLCWIRNNEKNSFFNLIKDQDEIKQVLSALKQFFCGLIQPISINGEFVKPFKIFKNHFILINQLAVYVENADSLQNIYISLQVLERILDDKQQHKKQKEQMKVIVEKVKKNKKVLKAEKKNQQKHSKYNYDEDYQVAAQQIKKVENMSNYQKVTRKSKSLGQIICFSCQKNFANSEQSQKCPKCLQVFHKDCLKQNKSLCQRCYSKNNRSFK
ncbi:unnamed protein product (macronuclear) [Paramecium tetraurelia]|uniref:WHIM2 domain-containing protein n=1 Tax=Paramecium tetraurelia TaxID=5888 RepID=A0C4U6_PARTE|nr:uncharacterized protein GSPATT00006312001 [Paramecium tetraurelia]CAK65813.1 unnamed protein product [Paramecium tetraurelia]|eukprot:XP_001433210.1 hypothetical protein (macronuclear) [Paramecium tetraurelia strain d4-2]